MIQRIQTLFLLNAIGFAIAFLFVPFGYMPVIDEVSGASVLQSMKAVDCIGAVIPTVIAVILMLVSIFSFKNYSLQKLMAVLSAVAVFVAIAAVVYVIVSPYVCCDSDMSIATEWGGGVLLAVASLLADFSAYHYICKDERLIKSYDRIR